MAPHSAAQAVTTAAQAATDAAKAMSVAAQSGNSASYWANWLLFGQDVILLATGGVIFWYTLENQRLRKVSSRQADLLRDQLQAVREGITRDMQEQVRRSRPVVVWRGGSFNGRNVCTWEFLNEGANVTDLVVYTDAALKVEVAKRILELSASLCEGNLLGAGFFKRFQHRG